MIKLGVNIDHVATLRQARKDSYPEPIKAALLAIQAGADNITCHLREDRRHIQERDIWLLKDLCEAPINFEMACTHEMLVIAKKLKPASVTLVPEKREELTTEGGLDVVSMGNRLKKAINQLLDDGIMVSLFIEADKKTIEASLKLKARAVEIHTGTICKQLDLAHDPYEKMRLIKAFNQKTKIAHEFGLRLHLGHGINYKNAPWFQFIDYVEEANIGHAIIGEAIFIGLESAVKKMKDLLNNPSHKPSLYVIR